MPTQLFGSLIRKFIHQEKIILLDLFYLAEEIENWWAENKHGLYTHLTKLSLIGIIQSNINPDDSYYFDKIGMSGISGVCVTGVFDIDDFRLAHVVHEALSEVFFLKDIDNDREGHKAIFLKPDAEKYSNWSCGYGEIMPHSDGLYDSVSTDIMALTVCRDLTNTPTCCYMMKDIFEDISDFELEVLLSSRAKFTSGRNTSGYKECIRPILEVSEQSGVIMNLDFRIDIDSGVRMFPIGNKSGGIINKLREGLLNCKPFYFPAKTGTFLAIANNKVLHARPSINLDKKLAELVSQTSTFSSTPRLLYRSKGPRYDISLSRCYSRYI